VPEDDVGGAEEVPVGGLDDATVEVGADEPGKHWL
jgi:hypothetical protein